MPDPDPRKANYAMAILLWLAHYEGYNRMPKYEDFKLDTVEAHEVRQIVIDAIDCAVYAEGVQETLQSGEAN